MGSWERGCYLCVFLADRCFSYFLRIIGPLLVIAANGLIGLVTYVYLTTLCPLYLLPRCGRLASGLIVAFGIYILFNILFNYWACVLTRPGYPGDHLQALEDLEAGQTSDGHRRYRFCRKCHVTKPERTHHCSVCNRCRRAHTSPSPARRTRAHPPLPRRCVMKMDHHCPWVNNCVGFYNYRYFLLFLVHLAVGCLLVICTCGARPPSLRALPRPHPAPGPFRATARRAPMCTRSACDFAARRAALPMLDGTLRRSKNSMLLFVAVLCVSVCFALTLFIGWHAYLVSTNQTTIEFYGNRFDAYDARQQGEPWRNEYDLGCRANLEQVRLVLHAACFDAQI